LTKWTRQTNKESTVWRQAVEILLRHPCRIDKKPDFTVQIMVSGHDDKKTSEQSWTWILSYLTDPSPADKASHGMGGMGIQSNAKLTARDVCMTVWDDIDPNHFKKPGGKIE